MKFIAFSLLSVLVFSAACFPPPPPLPETGADIVVFIGEGASFTHNTHQATLGLALDEIVKEHNIPFDYSVWDGKRFANRIGTQDARNVANGFIALYISYNNPRYGMGFETVVNGITFYSATKGIDELPVFHDVYYLLILRTF